MSVFVSEEDAKKQLKKDKHNLLEGYVSEYCFEKQFLSSGSVRYTKGWWIAHGKDEYVAFCYKEDFNEIDENIASYLLLGMPVWHVRFNGAWEFRNIKTNERLSLQELTKSYHTVSFSSPIEATSETRDDDRQTKCIEFFQRKGILIDIAEQRKFANDVLSPSFNGLINVDFFSINKRQEPCVIEIKFKYPANDNTFGFDKGLGDTFDYLSNNCRVKICHFILYKPIRSEEYSIFDYLKDTRVERFWLFARLLDIGHFKLKTAPSKTSVDGKKKQQYYALPVSLFKKYKSLGK